MNKSKFISYSLILGLILTVSALPLVSTLAANEPVVAFPGGSGGRWRDTTPPIVTITEPADGSTVSGTITISLTASDNYGVTGTWARIDDGLWVEGTVFTWDTTQADDGAHTIEAKAADAAGNYGYGSVGVTVDNGGTPPPPPPPPPPDTGEKIAVFFWATDAGAQWIIDRYTTILQAEGYTKFFNYCDTLNFEADFNLVDDYEDENDTVFFYLFGHGNYDGVDSYTLFRPYGSYVYSSEFRVMMDRLESTRKGFLIESCHSGGWPEDFQSSPYLSMSTSSTTLLAYAVGALPNEGIFSQYFWNHVEAGYNAIDSFWYAQSYVDGYPYTNQDPQIADYSDYIFFDN